MKRLSLFIVLLSLLACEGVKAQINVKTDPRVAPLLRQAANGQSNLVISGRKAASTMYVNIAVLDKTNKTLSWFTCYGTAYDSVQLKESEYQLIVANAVDPFVFYKDLCLENAIYLDSAASEYRRLGKLALSDTVYNRRVVYNSGQVRAAHSTLQQLMAIESLMKKQYLKLCLFNSPSPSQLSSNDNFRLYESLAGKMVSGPDSTIYYATSPLGVVTKIALCREDSLKMFVYDGQGHVLDSMPLRPEKYASLLKSRDDVFLLYRGWLELQSQQVQEALRQTAALLHRQDTGLYIQAYRVENRKQLLTGEMLLKAQQRDIERKISALVVPDQQMVEHMLRDTYPDGPAEMMYLSAGMGFAYTVSHERGEKLYELSDHRGNMMAAISDKKVDVDNGAGTIAYYNADVVNANDYYPFGALMPGRTYSADDKYRYGFNGKENDNEVKGEGNQQDYGMRIYDPRIGRFLSVDPLTTQFAFYSPYQFAGNKPIWATDLDGAEEVLTFPRISFPWPTLTLPEFPSMPVELLPPLPPVIPNGFSMPQTPTLPLGPNMPLQPLSPLLTRSTPIDESTIDRNDASTYPKPPFPGEWKVAPLRSGVKGHEKLKGTGATRLENENGDVLRWHSADKQHPKSHWDLKRGGNDNHPWENWTPDGIKIPDGEIYGKDFNPVIFSPLPNGRMMELMKQYNDQQDYQKKLKQYQNDMKKYEKEKKEHDDKVREYYQDKPDKIA